MGDRRAPAAAAELACRRARRSGRRLALGARLARPCARPDAPGRRAAPGARAVEPPRDRDAAGAGPHRARDHLLRQPHPCDRRHQGTSRSWRW
ncbi:hypothetical protein AB5I41_01070 [Sphingomonas sp. MMS24-JH45]